MFVAFRFLIWLPLLMYSGCAGVAPAEPADTAACRVERARAIDMLAVENQIIVPATINGYAAPVQIDTGTAITTLDSTVAAALKMRPDQSKIVILRGATGTAARQFVVLDSLTIGGQPWRRFSLPTGTVPQPADLDPRTAALIGADWLGEYDVEFDFAQKRMVLWNVSHCAGDFVPWQEKHSVIPLRTQGTNLLVEVGIDGHGTDAIIDTGAQTTIMDEGVARRLGVGYEALRLDRATKVVGITGTNSQAKRHVFSKVQIGNDNFTNATIAVSEYAMPGAGMLLGMDYLGHRHIWLSYATKQLFVAPIAR